MNQFFSFKLFLKLFLSSVAWYRMYLLNKKMEKLKEIYKNPYNSKKNHILRFFVMVLVGGERIKQEKYHVLLYLLFFR